MLTEYNRSRREKHHQSPGKELTYQYLCGNLSNYIFSSAINAKTSYSMARLKALRSFEDLFTEEFFLRRNVQMAKKMMEEIRLSRDRRMFFTVGAGMFFSSVYKWSRWGKCTGAKNDKTQYARGGWARELKVVKKVLIEVEKGGLKDNILIELSFLVFNKKLKF